MLKQTLHEARQHPVYTGIYIAGVALAIASTMIFAMVYFIKLAPVYPEYNRPNTLYISNVKSSIERDNNHWAQMWNFSYRMIVDHIYTLKNVDAVSARNGGGSRMLQPVDGSRDFGVEVKMIDPAFFRIYNFEFLQGRAFNNEEFDSGLSVAVISDRLANRLYGSPEAAMGQDLSVDYSHYRIIGVVREASYLTPQSFSQVYMPYTSMTGYDRVEASDHPAVGSYSVTMTVDGPDQEKALRAELAEMLRRVNMPDSTIVVSFENQPITHAQSVFKRFATDEFSWLTVIKQYGIVVVVLLIVPALNLSGMIAGRMDSSLPEMGVRKAFGANRSVLLRQVLFDNLYLTVAGALIGLFAAWLIVYFSREWLFSLFSDWGVSHIDSVSVELSGEMLFSPVVFAIALGVCLLLNLLSAYLPAWWSLRHPIVQSINEKR